VFHYSEELKKFIIFITGLHNKPQDCGASVASAAGPFTKKKKKVFNVVPLAFTWSYSFPSSFRCSCCNLFSHDPTILVGRILYILQYIFFSAALRPDSVSWPPLSRVSRSHSFRHITCDGTPLDEWSARRRDLYLTTRNNHKR
jgi:hypothetical protein